MRVIIQRTKHAKVIVNNITTGEINDGLLLLVGISPEDTDQDLQWACKKIINMRIFNDENGKMNRSLLDINGKLLIVSQFTLFASYKKGNRPSFTKSAKPDFAEKMYEKFIKICKQNIGENNVQTGIFGAYMQVILNNDGPVTIFLDTKNKE